MKAVVFTLSVMWTLFGVVVTAVSVYTHNWMPLKSFGIATATVASICGIQIPLMIWAEKKFGE